MGGKFRGQSKPKFTNPLSRNYTPYVLVQTERSLFFLTLSNCVLDHHFHETLGNVSFFIFNSGLYFDSSSSRVTTVRIEAVKTELVATTERVAAFSPEFDSTWNRIEDCQNSILLYGNLLPYRNEGNLSGVVASHSTVYRK